MEKIKSKLLLTLYIFVTIIILLLGVNLLTYKNSYEKAFALVDSGSCNENITWEFNTTTKILTISGTGAMPDYESVEDCGNEAVRPAWEETYRNDIETVVFENGITTIGECLFCNCDWGDIYGKLYPNIKSTYESIMNSNTLKR